jgi:hypothetical protein
MCMYVYVCVCVYICMYRHVAGATFVCACLCHLQRICIRKQNLEMWHKQDYQHVHLVTVGLGCVLWLQLHLKKWTE